MISVMARPKEFEREEVLHAAIRLFAENGYEGTSTDALMKAMGISRQSLYDTFGDKRTLYLESLNRYNGDSIGEIIRAAHGSAEPIAGIEAALLSFVSRPAEELGTGCLGVASICEFGTGDAAVNHANAAAARALRATFEGLLARARAAGSISPDIKPGAGADYVLALLAGLKVAARGGATSRQLRETLAMAMRTFR
jgi:TetR/AcrR family transcriptional repressor of nem operon